MHRCLFALVLVAAAPATAAACSLVSPFSSRDQRLSFIARATADTLRAGPGPIKPDYLGQPDSASRAIFGQRFVVEQLSREATRRLPPGTREVVIVSWAIGMDCRHMVLLPQHAPSARWATPGERGLYRAHLRPRSSWVGDIPTFDELGPHSYPLDAGDPASPDLLMRERLPARVLMELLDAPAGDTLQYDSLQAREAIRALRGEAAKAGHENHHHVIGLIRYQEYRITMARTGGTPPG